MENSILTKVSDFFKKMNATGIYIPLISDSGKGASVSLTLLTISSCLVIFSIIGKWSKFLGEVDNSAALNFFYASSALYFGRKISKDSKGTVTIEDSSKPKE